MSKRFYNPGANLDEMFKFDNPNADLKNENGIGYWKVTASPASFFEVPTDISFKDGDNETTIAVRFWDRIKLDWKKFGVVLVDAKAKQPVSEDDNVALNDKDAKAKGDRLWRDATIELVSEHRAMCDEMRSNGFTPKRAIGNVARALRELGIEDPANDVQTVLERKQDNDEVSALKSQLADLQKTVLALAGTKVAATK